MFKCIFLFIIAASLYNYQEWKIDENFNIRFHDRYADGYFEDLSGKIVFDTTSLQNAFFDVAVATASINTGNKLKNKHAKGDKWLDAGQFPDISFISDSVYKNEKYFVRGDLKIKGITKKIIIPFSFSRQNDSTVFEGMFKIDRASYGLGKSKDGTKDSATIWLRVPVSPE